MADTTQTAAFPLATNGYTSDGGGSGGVDDNGGASGSTSGEVTISVGAMVAIIVVVVFVAVGGIASAVLFYLAKKREWKVRERIRRSARKVVTALTPRRSEFPKNVRDGRPDTSRGRVRLDDIPPTPRLPQDLEKAMGDGASGRSSSSRDGSGSSSAGKPTKASMKFKLASIGRK